MAENENWWDADLKAAKQKPQDNWWEDDLKEANQNNTPAPQSPDLSTNVIKRDITVPTQNVNQVQVNPNVEQPNVNVVNPSVIEPSLPEELKSNPVKPEAQVPNAVDMEMPSETDPEITQPNVNELEIEPVTIDAPFKENLPEYLEYKPFAVVRKNIDPASLETDRDWITASDRVYSMLNQGKFNDEDDASLAEYGKDLMGWFNYNLPAMAYVTSYVLQADQETKEAFLWMMDTYDQVDYSWEGFTRFASGLALDPTTYAGIATVGAGFWGKFATKSAAKATLKAKLMQSLGRSGLPAALEGGILTFTDDAMRQNIEISAGRLEEFDYVRSGKKTGIGLGGGLILGTSADFAFGGIINTASNVKNVGTVPDTSLPSNQPYLSNQASQTVTTPTVKPKKKGPLLDVPDKNTSLSNRPRSLSENLAEGLQVADQLRALDNQTLDDVLQKIVASDTMDVAGRVLDPESMDVVAAAVFQHLDELRIQYARGIETLNKLDDDATKMTEAIAKRKELEELDDRIIMLTKADEAIGGQPGYSMRLRQERLLNSDGDIKTPKQIADETGVTIDEARAIYLKQADKLINNSQVIGINKQYNPMIDKAIKAGKFDEAAKLTAQRNRLVENIEKKLAPEKSGIIAKATEAAISNVFSFKTLIMNTIPSGTKTLLIPGMKALLNNPLNKATRVEAYAAYKAMGLNAKFALKASLEAFKYEQALLTRDSNRILEGGSAWQGTFGGVLRLFPRLLNSTDEFMSQINYASFVSGRAAGKAAIEASEKGLKGKEFDDFVRKATEEAMEKSFAGTTGDDLINPIISKGLNKGYTGDKLFNWVETQLAADKGILTKLGYKKDASLFRRGQDEEALNFVRDVLYKRDFTGEGGASRVAQGVNTFIKENGWLKIATGQLFLRTPIRVFEEGFRLTPGIQLLAPKFLDDLKGKNGLQRQTRARGEALMSQALAGYFFVKYSSGELTSGGEYSNYDQIKNRRDTNKPQPYTIKFDDGSTWSYRNFDPVATPFKILSNAFDGMKMLDLRRAQGEFIDDAEYEKYANNIIVGMVALTRAVKDAGLFEGLNQLGQFGSILLDPESSDDAVLKILRDKLNLAMPNTIRKVARENDPYMRDPKNLYQLLETTFIQPIQSALNIDGHEIKTSYSYDVLGNRRQSTPTSTMLDPSGGVLDFFSTDSVEDRAKGRSEETLFVLSALDDLSKTADLTIRPVVKHPDIPNMDFRTVMTSDGKQTLYDRYNEIYAEFNVAEILYPILNSGLPSGTRKEKGLVVDEVRSIISSFQKSALDILLSENKELINKQIQQEIKAEEDPIKNFKSY